MMFSKGKLANILTKLIQKCYAVCVNVSRYGHKNGVESRNFRKKYGGKSLKQRKVAEKIKKSTKKQPTLRVSL